EIVRDMIEQIIVDHTINVKSIREEVAIMMSCKRSIKANHYLDMNEMNQLLNELRTCEDPFTCTHGRPVIIHFNTYEIEKMIKRIMLHTNKECVRIEKVIVIVGLTAVGKTELSLNLAVDMNGEIISGNWMQVYKKLDIGTDKVS